MGEGRPTFQSEEFAASSEASLDGVLYLVFGSLGVLGHLGVLLTFLKGGVTTSPKHVLHLHFTIANIGVIILYPLPGISLLSGRWMFGDGWCNMYGFVTFFSGLAAIGLIAALAAERYLANCWSQMYANLSSGHLHLAAMFVWGHALFWATMPATKSWSRFAYEPGHMTCNLDWTSGDASHAAFIKTITPVCFIIPFAMVFICLMLSNMALEKMEESKEDGVMTEEQLWMISVGLVLTSILTWTPCAANCMYSVLRGGDQNPSLLRVAVPALAAKAGTSAISLIYPSLSPPFRKGLSRLFFGGDPIKQD